MVGCLVRMRRKGSYSFRMFMYVCVCLGGSVVGGLACIHIVTSLMMMHVTLGLDRNVHKDANAHGNPFGLLSGE